MSATHPRPRTLLPLALLALFACRDSTGPSSRDVGQIQLDSVVILDGGTAQVGIRYVDRSGAPMDHLPEGLVLRWTSLDTTVAIVRGGWVTGMRAGETEIRVEAGSLTASARVRVQPAAPTLVALGGQGQTGHRRETLDRTLDVLVLDAHRRPLRDAEVEFVATAGGGTLSPPLLRTDSTGRASASWTLGAVPGEQKAEARVRGPGPVPVVFTARALDQIAFGSVRDGNEEIYLINEDGSGLRNLTNHPGSDAAPVWSPDGTKILFYSSRDGNAELYVMDADGSRQTRLTRNEASDGYHSWSPDGTRIVFTSPPDGSRMNPNSELYVMNADGSNQRRLTHDSCDDNDPAWSPDGTRIVILKREGPPSLESCPGGLFVINADGSSPRALRSFDHTVTLSAPRWSPDGTTIAYTVQRMWYSPYLHLINADGTGDRLVFPLVPLSFYGQPGAEGHVWSPDGKMLAFAYSGDYLMNRIMSLRVTNVDGSDRRLSMREPSDEDIHPSWSPDGSRLAFTRIRRNFPLVYVVPLDGSSAETPLTPGPEGGFKPVWRP